VFPIHFFEFVRVSHQIHVRKSIPNSPKAGINTRKPNPAERCITKGLYSLKLLYEAPASTNPKTKMDAADFNVRGYLNSMVNLL
jgi:hypothetical protein